MAQMVFSVKAGSSVVENPSLAVGALIGFLAASPRLREADGVEVLLGVNPSFLAVDADLEP